MHVRLGFFIIPFLIVFSFSQTSYGANGPRVVRIGTVLDGPPQSKEWGKIFQRKLFQEEIFKISRGKFNVQFPTKKQIHGNWNPARIKRAVDYLLKDPNVDVVLALGVLVSNEVGHRTRLPKPVIAPFVINEKIQRLPFRNGKSGIKNLNYLTTFTNLARQIQAFKEVIQFSHLVVLVDGLIAKTLPERTEEDEQIEKDNDITLTYLPVDTTIKPTLDALPPNTDAVFVTPLLRLPTQEFDRLVSGLIDRRLPSYSMLGVDEVERGLLATVEPKAEMRRLARRVALNVHQIIRGENAGRLNVTFSRGVERLTINMATARAADTWPSFRVLTEAELLHEEVERVARRLSLYQVVREAVVANLDLAAADRRVEAGLGEINEARAELLPQIDIGSLGIQVWDRSDLSEGGKPSRVALASSSLSQLIYSDKAWANYTIQQKTQKSRVAERRQLQLDIVQDAALAYLLVLRTKTIQDIVKDNLKLTRSNLERARMREAVGAAARDEVFRWQSEIADGRIQVLEAQADTRKSKVLLNRLLHRPLKEPFVTEEAGLDDPLLLISQKRLMAFIDNPRDFDIFRDFEVQEGLRASPELHRLDALIQGQQRTLVNAERSYWAPEIALGSQFFQRFASDQPEIAGSENLPIGPIGLAVGSNKTLWISELGITFPLFAGGSKDATYTKTHEELRELRLERAATLGRVEERVHIAMYDAGASFSSIRLAQESAEAARSNLKLVLDQYSRGAVDIIKVVNSQNAALEANQLAANAVYLFLIDFMNIQRSVGRFDYFMYSEEREKWFQRLKAYFTKAGVKIK